MADQLPSWVETNRKKKERKKIEDKVYYVLGLFGLGNYLFVCFPMAIHDEQFLHPIHILSSMPQKFASLAFPIFLSRKTKKNQKRKKSIWKMRS
jgi:hypothetical protein